jgi:hypothetical protein
MQNSENLSQALPNAKDDQIGQPGQHQLASASLTSQTGPAWKPIQRAYSREQSQSHTARRLCALVSLNVVANVSEVSSGWLRPADTAQPE